ncbi:hypothetical protein B0H14DRAFT_3438710 [Mycena olivaceomarginata]|nr:hypothetical protein B0H14DRAFT_3438710 [Mycena olivaceomarginata]
MFDEDTPMTELEVDSSALVIARHGNDSQEFSPKRQLVAALERQDVEQTVKHLRGEANEFSSKRQLVAAPERQDVEQAVKHLRGEAKFYKDKLDSTKDKLKEKTAEYQDLHEYLKTVQKNMEHMNLNLQETASHQRQMAESYNADRQAHLGMIHKLQADTHQRTQQANQAIQFGERTLAQNQKLQEELQTSRALKEAEEKKAREFERAAIERANEAATLRAKLANQASGLTPRSRRTKIMGDVEMRNITAKLPVIPFSPIPLPAPNASAGNDAGANTAVRDMNLAELAAALQQLPGATAGITTKTTRSKETENEKSWKKLLKETKNAHCGVQNAEQFVLTTSASPAEVEACQDSLLLPGAKDFRFDFNEGYRQSRWNNLIIDKIVDYACASEDGRRLHPVPRGWLVDKLRGQMYRAREAWARPQPRCNETEEEATVRSNEYREIRAANVRGNSAKARKYHSREQTIQFLIKIKSGTAAPDLESWKRLLQMLEYLGFEGMSSEEEVEILSGGKRFNVFRVKLCVWRAEDVTNYLQMIDSQGKKLDNLKQLQHKGPKPLPRHRDGTPGASGAPTKLPECLYNAEWIKEMSARSPVFYEDLQVSKETFHLLATAANLVV